MQESIPSHLCLFAAERPCNAPAYTDPESPDTQTGRSSPAATGEPRAKSGSASEPLLLNERVLGGLVTPDREHDGAQHQDGDESTDHDGTAGG